MAQQISPFTLRNVQTDQKHPILPGGLRVGRTPENNVVLNDEKVSRNHATLWAQGDQLYIRDENSTNGTWVNGERITAPKVLQAGDQVRIGDTVFDVAIGAAPPLVAEAPAPAQAALPILPIAITGGVVLVIFIALMIRATGRGTTVLPTATPTLTLTPTVTVVPTDTPTPTSTPTCTPTPVLSTPIPQAVQPELASPAQGKEYNNPITFEWSGVLSAGQAYQVTAYHPGSDYTVQSELLTTPEWSVNLPPERYGEWRWTVSVLQSGVTVTTSAEWMFWFQPFPGAKETPQVTDTPVPPTVTPTPGFRP